MAAAKPRAPARKRSPRAAADPRAELTAQVLMGGRKLSTAAVMFHAVLAERQGLGATEGKALDLIDRFGPLTAGELGERAGLAPASVTGLVDRLERKGFARRIKDPQDGRRVLVELDRTALMQLAPLYDDLVHEMQTLAAEFSVEQLKVIVRFLEEAARRQMAATGRLAAAPTGSGSSRDR